MQRQIENLDASELDELERKIKRQAFTRKLIILVSIIMGVGAIGYVAYDYFDPPAIFRAQIGPPFELSKLDVQHQYAVIGKNARWVTDEDIQDLVSAPRPKIVDYASIKTVENMSRISLIPFVGQGTRRVEIFREPTRISLNGKGVGAPYNLHISSENQSAFGPVIPEGINTNTGELFVDMGYFFSSTGERLVFSPERPLFYTMYIKYEFDNHKYVVLNLTTGQGFLAATDFLKDAPTIDIKSGYATSSGQVISGENFFETMEKATGKKFNITNPPALFTGETFNINAWVLDGGTKGSISIPAPKMTGGDILIGSFR